MPRNTGNGSRVGGIPKPGDPLYSMKREGGRLGSRRDCLAAEVLGLVGALILGLGVALALVG